MEVLRIPYGDHPLNLERKDTLADWLRLRPAKPMKDGMEIVSEEPSDS